MEKVEAWIRDAVGDASDREIAKVAGLGQSTLSRQRREGTVTVETVVGIARAYQVSVIPALLAMGIVTENDVAKFSAQARLKDASDEELADEVLRRMKAGSEIMTAPISTVENHLQSRKATVSQLPSHGEGEASKTGDIEPERYVAKRKKPEPGEGDDDYGPGA